jgi:hypothetical protein
MDAHPDLAVSPSGSPLAEVIGALGIGDEIDWRPDHLAASAWLEHVPFAFWVVKALRPRAIVELGTHWGVSYGAFCQAVDRLALATRCHAVDSWEGDPHAGECGEEVFAAVRSLNDTRWRRFSTLLRMTFARAREFFEAGEVDLLHIDGYHTYEAAAGDFRLWRETLSDRGVVLFHDTNVRRDDFGVWRLWHELKADHPHFEFVHGHGLGVAGVGDALPAPLRALFAAAEDPGAAAAIRGLFASRGEAVRLRWLAHDAEARLRAATEERQGLSARLRTLEAAHGAAIAAADERLRSAEERLRSAEAAWRQVERREATLRDRLRMAEREAEALRARTAEAEAAAHRLAQDAAALRARYDALVRSTSWRITRPLRAAVGLARREPAYVARLRGLLGRPAAPPAVPALPGAATPAPAPAAPPRPAPLAGATLVASRLPAPLLTFPDPDSPRRLTMLTDSINAGSLFGGVGTAMILAVLLARRLGVPLRVVTRTEPPETANFGAVLRAQGVRCDGNVEFLHSGPPGVGRRVPIGAGDVLLTTSWWTTWAALAAVRPDRIIYLLQEDERLFYPAGDQQLRCREVMCDTRLRFVLNTAALRDHLARDGMRGVAANGIAFEPAFPEAIYHREPRPAGAKRRLFFYARPSNDRNLFLRGLEALSGALVAGHFPPEEWELHFVGKDVPELVMPGGVRPHVAENLPWEEYAALVRSVDVGLSLMYTPHPSYPPLDLAASGAVVVTNRCGAKTSLDHYCRNILCAEPSVEALVAALAEAEALAADEPRRAANHREARIGRDWEAALAPVVERLAAAV